MNKIAIYIHWPFCLSKCPYCDFNSHVSGSIDTKLWEEAYLKEIESFTYKIKGRNISSIFFGGGTPSLMPPTLVESIINKLSSIGSVDKDEKSTEITLEANPTSVEAKKFKDFRASGINRVSIGVQSLKHDDLKFLGREHDVENAISAIELAKQIFPRSSFDLIYARPQQSLKDWQEELKEALKIAPNHLSLYQLTIEKGTPFYKMHNNKDFFLPENDTAADMYNYTNEYLKENNYTRYEISNYAKTSEESRHNLAYWNYDEYIGIGPGAHSRINNNNSIYALMNIHNPNKWLEQTIETSSGIQKNTLLTKEEIVEEILMMGLRLEKGINSQKLLQLTNKNFIEILNLESLQKYIDAGFIIYDGNNLQLTEKGLLMHSYIVPRIIAQ